jgi:hypothetical protein
MTINGSISRDPWHRNIVDWFISKVKEQVGGNYQSMLNSALRKHIEHQDQHLEEILRRVLREELRASQLRKIWNRPITGDGLKQSWVLLIMEMN